MLTTVQTKGHTPRPATFNRDKCAICGTRITTIVALVGDERVPTRRFIHVVDNTLFDGLRQKALYERLDVVADALTNANLTLPELAEALRTIHSWRDHTQLWKTVRRWLKDHGEEL